VVSELELRLNLMHWAGRILDLRHARTFDSDEYRKAVQERDKALRALREYRSAPCGEQMTLGI
jgi:hypothetical protein